MLPEQPNTTLPPQTQMLRNARDIDLGRQRTVDQVSAISSLAQSVSGVIREYPGPSMLIGAGLAWMFVSREQNKAMPLPQRLRYRAARRKDQLEAVAGDAREQLSDSASNAREGLRDAAQNAREAAHSAKEQTLEKLDGVRASASESLEQAKHTLQDQAERTRIAADHFAEEHPLILGAIAAAMGLAIGLSLPATERENQVMGPTRDSLLDQARSIVENARHAAVESLRSGAETVKSHLEEAAADAKSHLAEAASEAKSALTESVENAKESVKEDVEIAREDISNDASSRPLPGSEPAVLKTPTQDSMRTDPII